MGNPFDLIKKVYMKTKVTDEELEAVDFGTNVLLIKVLGQNASNLDVLEKIVPYQFYVEPKHLFMMIYVGIKRVFKVPYFKMPKKQKEEVTELYKQVQSHFFWSDRELGYNMPLLDFLSSDVEYWNTQFGLVTKKKRRKK